MLKNKAAGGGCPLPESVLVLGSRRPLVWLQSHLKGIGYNDAMWVKTEDLPEGPRTMRNTSRLQKLVMENWQYPENTLLGRKLSLNCLFAGRNNNNFDICRPPGN